MRLLVALLALGAAVACGPRGNVSSNRASWPVVELRCDVGDATVWIDDGFVGRIATLPAGVRISPGKHRIEVRHDRYHTRYLEVTLVKGERRTLEVSLAEAFP